MKNKFRRLLSLALCLCMTHTGILGSLSACTKTPDDENEMSDVPTISLIDDTTEYKVIRPEITAQSVIMSAAGLRTSLEDATRVAIDIDTDFVMRGETVPVDTPEILVGATNRAESQQVLETLSEKEFAIQMVGKRLVIVGYDDDCTIAAVNYFIENILGYDSETDTYSATKLLLKENYSTKGTYTPTVVPPTYETIFGEQNKPTTSPATYVLPYHELKNGLYVQNYDSFDLQGVRTTFQASVLYTDTRAVNADSVMVYSTSGKNFTTWYESEDYVVDMMIAINRADASYLSLDKRNYNDIQMDAAGEYLEHPAGGSYYMVPSKDWIEFAWYEMLLPMIEQYHPQTIALEEPEMWIRSGYSQTFKEEWEDFYGEKWEAPHSSAAANLKANLLKTYLFERILTEISKRVKEVSPNTQLYIATHSTVNYAAWNITAGLNSYLALDCIDGVIGQTWADTHNSAFPYNGSGIVDNFTNAFIEYASYVDSVEGTNFYALADPVMDNESRTEEGCQYFYRQSIAAQLMQPEINRFQILPWVQRAYAGATSAYRTVQAQIFAMLNDIGGEEITMTAGTPGISYLASDSLSWMNPGSGWSLNPTDGMYGLCAPLVRDGVPVKMKAMEQIYTTADLEGVSLLMASYDTSVPLSEEVNIAIADWVKKGGTLLYISGHNQYWDIEDYFFWADDETPLYNLLRHLGLENITVNTGSNSGIKASTRLSALESDLEIFNDHQLANYANYAISFNGAENPILKAGNKVIGFEEYVGKGAVIVMGIPTAAFAQYKGGSPMLKTLVEYALDFTDYEYVSSELMLTERGKYVIAHAFDEPVKLEGTYINLFDEHLAVLVDPVVPKEDSLILVNVDHYDLSIPRLGFSSGEVDEASLKETKDTTTYQFTSATNTTICNRLLAPKGVYPKSVTVTNESGTQMPLLSVLWDDESNSLRFTVDGSRKPLTITVEWGNQKGELEGSAFVYEEINIAVNSTELDKKYVHSSTAALNDTCRYCDLDRQLVYRFDTTEFDFPIYQFNVAQNYIIEVSGDGETWEMVADYSEGGTVEHIKNADNALLFSIDPTDYEAVEETGILYVRFRNSNISMGWGARVSSLTIRHLVEADADAGENTDWLKGKNNTSGINDNAINTPSPDGSEAKYLVKTENGVSTYKRKVNTNQNNEDIEFIIFNTSEANDAYRYCDHTRQLVYYFDVSRMIDCELTFRVLQNYIVEVSNDGENWEIVANYYDISGGKHLTDGGNDVNIVIDPFDYDCEDTGDCYVRLRNCDTSTGWGATVRYFEMNYTKPAK